MKEIQINELTDFKIGHAQDEKGGTGCTVILCEKGAVAGVDVRGGGPATRETDLLNPKNMVEQIHAVTLAGGSAFGLEASCGVMAYLSEHEIGFDMKGIYIPIVSGACLFDCSVADSKAYPTKKMGYQACQNASHELSKQGCIGAGTGASVGKFLGFDKAMKTGLGHAAFQVGDVMVAAIVAVNACGDVYFENSEKPIAGIYDYQKKKRLSTLDVMFENQPIEESCGMNTTIGCILTNAKLTKAQANKIASMSHNGYARTIRPVHTSSDGDTIFAMASQQVEAQPDVVGALAAKAMAKAIENACLYATPMYGLTTYSEIHQ